MLHAPGLRAPGMKHNNRDEVRYASSLLLSVPDYSQVVKSARQGEVCNAY